MFVKEPFAEIRHVLPMLHVGRGSITVSVSVFEAVLQSRARHTSVVEAEVHGKPAEHGRYPRGYDLLADGLPQPL